MIVQKVHGGNVFVNGVNLFGTIEEVELPDIKPIEQDHKALGAIGVTEHPVAFDKLVAKFKFNTIATQATTFTNQIFSGVLLQIRGVRDSYGALGARTGREGLVVTLEGRFKGMQGAMFKAQDFTGKSTEFAVTSIRIVAGNVPVELIYVNVQTQEYRVNGIDQMAGYRQLLGLQ